MSGGSCTPPPGEEGGSTSVQSFNSSSTDDEIEWQQRPTASSAGTAVAKEGEKLPELPRSPQQVSFVIEVPALPQQISNHSREATPPQRYRMPRGSSTDDETMLPMTPPAKSPMNDNLANHHLENSFNDSLNFASPMSSVSPGQPPIQPSFGSPGFRVTQTFTVMRKKVRDREFLARRRQVQEETTTRRSCRLDEEKRDCTFAEVPLSDRCYAAKLLLREAVRRMDEKRKNEHDPFSSPHSGQEKVNERDDGASVANSSLNSDNYRPAQPALALGNESPISPLNTDPAHQLNSNGAEPHRSTPAGSPQPETPWKVTFLLREINRLSPQASRQSTPSNSPTTSARGQPSSEPISPARAHWSPTSSSPCEEMPLTPPQSPPPETASFGDSPPELFRREAASTPAKVSAAADRQVTSPDLACPIGERFPKPALRSGSSDPIPSSVKKKYASLRKELAELPVWQ